MTVRTTLKRMGITTVAILCLAALLLALPVPVWRTGRLPAQPLPVVKNGPSVETPNRIWIDTDAACGLDRSADPDDCLALMLLARASNLEIKGVSTVFGNASLPDTDETVRTLAAKLRSDGAQIPKILRGAEAPEAASTPVLDGLRRALADGPLTIVALGPLTNIASAVKGRPDLQKNVQRLVAVMGRRPGHIFHPSEGNGHGMLFGHGPVFRDLNFDKDPGAVVDLFRMELPISLIPYDVARGVSLTGGDLARIRQSGSAGAWVVLGARGWLDFWQEDIGLEGFHPFDLLAAAYVLWPVAFNCAEAPAWIGHDDRLNNFWFFDPVALQVGVPAERPDDTLAATEVIYCVQSVPALPAWLMGRLADDQAQTDSH